MLAPKLFMHSHFREKTYQHVISLSKIFQIISFKLKAL